MRHLANRIQLLIKVGPPLQHLRVHHTGQLLQDLRQARQLLTIRSFHLVATQAIPPGCLPLPRPPSSTEGPLPLLQLRQDGVVQAQILLDFQALLADLLVVLYSIIYSFFKVLLGPFMAFSLGFVA